MVDESGGLLRRDEVKAGIDIKWAVWKGIGMDTDMGVQVYISRVSSVCYKKG